VHWLVVVLVIEDPGEVLWGVDWARSNWGSSRLWDVNVFCSGLFFMVAIDIDWLVVTVVGMAGTVVLGDVSGRWSISVVVVAVVLSSVAVVAVSVVRVIGGVGVLVVVGLFTVVGVFVTVVVGLFIGVMVVGVGVVCVVISITGKVAVGWVMAMTVATGVRVVIIVI
jgi:hypothetical protein